MSIIQFDVVVVGESAHADALVAALQQHLSQRRPGDVDVAVGVARGAIRGSDPPPVVAVHVVDAENPDVGLGRDPCVCQLVFVCTDDTDPDLVDVVRELVRDSVPSHMGCFVGSTAPSDSLRALVDRIQDELQGAASDAGRLEEAIAALRARADAGGVVRCAECGAPLVKDRPTRKPPVTVQADGLVVLLRDSTSVAGDLEHERCCPACDTPIGFAKRIRDDTIVQHLAGHVVLG